MLSEAALVPCLNFSLKHDFAFNHVDADCIGFKFSVPLQGIEDLLFDIARRNPSRLLKKGPVSL